MPFIFMLFWELNVIYSLLMKKATLEVDDPLPKVSPLHPAIYCVLRNTRHRACLCVGIIIESSPDPKIYASLSLFPHDKMFRKGE